MNALLIAIVISLIVVIIVISTPSTKENMKVAGAPLVDSMARAGRTYSAVYLDGTGAKKTPRQPLYATLDVVSVEPPKYSLAVHFVLPPGSNDILGTGLSTIRYTGTFLEGDSSYSVLAPDYPKYVGSEEYIYRAVPEGVLFQHIVNGALETQIGLNKR